MAITPVLRNPSRAHLKSVMGGMQRAYPWVEFLSTEMSQWKDDFQGLALQSGLYTTNVVTSGVAAAVLVNQTNGLVRLTTGTTNGGVSSMALGLHYRGQLNAVVMARMKVSAITAVDFELGFADAVSPTNSMGVNVLATPTFNVTDGAFWAFDTNDTSHFKCVGVQSGVAATSIAPGSTVDPVAATYATYMVALMDTSAFFYIFDVNGKKIYDSDLGMGGTGAPGGMLNAVTATVDLTPFIGVRTRSTTSISLDVDYLWAWQRRTVDNP